MGEWTTLLKGGLMLTPEAKKIIIDCYRERFLRFKTGPEVAEWKSVESQHSRFAQLAQLGDMSGKRILDIGCGIADIYPFLLEKFGDINYTGVDLVSESVNYAKTLYQDVRLECRDIIEEPFPERFDYVLISGIFNSVIPEAESFLKTMTTAAFNHANIALGFNFLSSYKNYADASACYHDPYEVLKHCLDNLSWKTNMLHHYFRTDVSVSVYR